jgi:hypothetical protein
MQHQPPDYAAMLLQFFDNPQAGLAARDAFRSFQEAQARWLAAAEGASAFRREHPGQPLPSNFAGSISEMIGELEALKQKLEQAFGSTLPEQTRAGLQGMYQGIAALRAMLSGTEN